MKKTPPQWNDQEIGGLRILDYDGPIRDLMDTPIPRGQFLQLRRPCTVLHVAPKLSPKRPPVSAFPPSRFPLSPPRHSARTNLLVFLLMVGLLIGVTFWICSQ